MASNTENLNLLMKNPSTDGADTFNVQTMLNENWQKIDNNAGTVAQTLANILKPTTPPIIGLPPSTTPDGMFRALGNTGELHVWRKTVKTSSDTPAGYTLGDTLTHGNSFIVRQTTGTGYVDAVIQEASSISVNDNGVISASWGSTITLRYGNSVTFTPGRFVKISSINTKALSSFAVDDVVWVPSDGGIQMNFSNDYGYYIEFTKCQKVNAHGIIPAGTTTTYPVSTNPNAYQEGSDAKPAGYTLGEVVTGNFRMSDTAPRNAYLYKYANSVAVKENGGVVLQNPEAVNFNSDSHIGYESTVLSLIAGKFLYYYGRDSMAAGNSAPDTQPPFNATPSEIVYVPADAAITSTNTYPAGFYLDKYQPVTGYAAIPANTTIEYLGCLGDKARVRVVSYVGTGTYGSDHPNSLTFDFAPKVVIFLRKYNKNLGQSGHLNSDYRFDNRVITPESLTTEYTRYNGFGKASDSYAKKSKDGRTIYWYNSDEVAQGNSSGYIYYFLVID